MTTTISEYFSGIAAKRLSNVEINSNQHEFNGINKFRDILGTERCELNGRIIYFTDDEDTMIDNSSTYTWYDVRANNPKRSAEFRLYYSDNVVVPNASVGDLVIMGKTIDDELTIIVAEQDSTAEKQLLYLFGLEEVDDKFSIKDYRNDHRDIGFPGRYILQLIGIEVGVINELEYLEDMKARFGDMFPTTAIFSEYARSTVADINVYDDPDHALISWWEREGQLLRLFERTIISDKLNQGFNDDVDEFIQFALTIINRRKSRAGHSFENHLKAIFDLRKISYSKGQRTERKNKPDFIFPSIEAYHDTTFPEVDLYMLGVKTTAKDRWRQVLSEADRIAEKHLITLEPAISVNQTNEMLAQSLKLIIPKPLHNTYLPAQLNNIMSLNDFIGEIRR